MMTIPIQIFRDALADRFRQAVESGQSSVEVKSGDLHRAVGGYPSPSHAMPSCCLALHSAMTDGDKIIKQPPKGFGATLTIQFQLPRKESPTTKRIELNQLTVGQSYDRNELAKKWGYADFHAIGRGVVTPKGEPTIVLFITENAQEALTQYVNSFDGETLWMEGEAGHGSDQRLSDSFNEDDEVLLFHRVEHHTKFTFQGRVYLTSATINTDSPSRFMFSVEQSLALLSDDTVEQETNPSDEDKGRPEGMKKWRSHVVYERSRKNRNLALKIHGHSCKACEFNFDNFYGSELADSFIQVHHTQSITELDGRVPNPEVDLVPLCANCHCMVHRKKGEIMPVEELKAIIQKAKS